MAKIVGLILALAGIVLIACPLLFKAKVEKIITSIPLVSGINILWIMIAGVVLGIIGAFLLRGETKQKEKEVPIYKGNEIVGYRRGYV